MSKAFIPEHILPAGEDNAIVVNPFTGVSGRARKGTVAATLNNIALLNQLLLADNDENREQVLSIKKSVEELINSLKYVGIFNLFSIEEWLNEEQQPGRIYVAILYLKHNPDELTDQIKSKLQEIAKAKLSPVISQEIKTIYK